MAWLPSEDLLLLNAVRSYGAQWDRIAGLLPGRTMDAARNRWYRLQKNAPQQALLGRIVTSNALAAQTVRKAEAGVLQPGVPMLDTPRWAMGAQPPGAAPLQPRLEQPGSYYLPQHPTAALPHPYATASALPLQHAHPLVPTPWPPAATVAAQPLPPAACFYPAAAPAAPPAKEAAAPMDGCDPRGDEAPLKGSANDAPPPAPGPPPSSRRGARFPSAARHARRRIRRHLRRLTCLLLTRQTSSRRR